MTGKLSRAAELQLILKYESKDALHGGLVPHRATDENRG